MRDHYGMAVFDTIDEVLAPAHSGLIVVDMQNDLVNPEGAYARAGEDCSAAQFVIEPISRLIASARAARVPIFYTMNTTLPDGQSDSAAWAYFKNYSRPGTGGAYTIEGTWGWEIIDELAPQPADRRIRKHRSDAFVGTDLDLLLKAAEVKTVVTCGIVTNGCVESSARHAAFLDYYSVVVGDACASSSLELHEAALAILRGRHDVVTVQMVEELWTR